MSPEPLQPQHCYRHPDRETYISCSNCERPICTECMTSAAVGIRCPECLGTAGRTRVVRPAVGHGNTMTMALVVINCVVFLAELLTAHSGFLAFTAGRIMDDGGVVGAKVADGEWYRLITAGFIHAGVAHIAMNMWALWILGGVLEDTVGRARMLLIYLTAILWGSVGALLLDPNAVTVGASGGIFGLMGAMLVLARVRGARFNAGGVAMLLVINLGFTFAVPGISIGGHLGGAIGGALAGVVLLTLGHGRLSDRVHPPVVAACVGLMAVAVMGGVALA
ncbi:MAG: rhomboid family intramembrane serine protease [Thermoleophilia bacterium]